MVWGESSSILSVVFKISSGSSEIGAAGGAVSGAMGGAVGGATVGSAVGSGNLRRRPPQSLWPPRSAMVRLLFPAAAAERLPTLRCLKDSLFPFSTLFCFVRSARHILLRWGMV